MIEIFPVKKKVVKNVSMPGSKSQSIRALFLASLAKRKSVLKNVLISEDTEVVMRALKQLGIKIYKSRKMLIVEGLGSNWHQSRKPLNMGNSGSAARFFLVTSALFPFSTILLGSQNLVTRPIQDLIKALKKMGVQVQFLKKKDFLPLIIQGPLQGGKTQLHSSLSSQFLSALLLAAPLAPRKVSIQVIDRLSSKSYVYLTLKTMKDFGVSVENFDDRLFEIEPQSYHPREYKIEGDASAASYPLALAALTGGEITIGNIFADSAQGEIKFLDVLAHMGCSVKKTSKGITVKGSGTFRPLGNIDLNDLPDSAMTVAILCSFAQGKSILTNIGHLRLKECDRLKALANELTKIGVKIIEGKDFLEIHGDPDHLKGATIETYNDHRMAMCFAMVGARVPGIIIKNPDCVRKSYPDFWKDLRKWGVRWRELDGRSRQGLKNLVLTGLRGSGKTLIGNEMAKILKVPFIDTDKFIEQRHQQKITQMVAKKGWPYFRRQEEAIIKDLSEVQGSIISTGGGMLMNSKNRARLKKNGIVILFHTRPEILAKRTKNSRNRPRLTKAKTLEQEFIQVWQERRGTYLKTADLVFETSLEKDQDRKKDSQKKARQLLETLKSRHLI
jgi:3-phosphoshikimate 1-carboxyvinyltransferase